MTQKPIQLWQVEARLPDHPIARNLVIGQPGDMGRPCKQNSNNIVKIRTLTKNMYTSRRNGVNYKIPRISHEDIKGYMKRKLAHQNQGMLITLEIKSVINQWADDR